MADVSKTPATDAAPELESTIKRWLVTGFANWEGGYDGWLQWYNPLSAAY